MQNTFSRVNLRKKKTVMKQEAELLQKRFRQFCSAMEQLDLETEHIAKVARAA